MSEEQPSSDRAVTVANIQRLESGYFEHMESLRGQVPIDEYVVTRNTGRMGLLAMVLISLGLLVLFPFTMFYSYTYLVIVVYLAAFIVIGWVFYDRVMVPNEGTEEWRD